MKKINKIVSYRKWVGWWDLIADQHEEIQRTIDKENQEGWNIIQFVWTNDNFSITRWIKIIIGTCCSLGFYVYWRGAVMIFEKEVE